jgi:hypothetical protein
MADNIFSPHAKKTVNAAAGRILTDEEMQSLFNNMDDTIAGSKLRMLLFQMRGLRCELLRS